MSREPIGKISVHLSPVLRDTVVAVTWADGVTPRSRVTYRGKAAHVDPETSRVIRTDAYVDGRDHPYVYEYETPLPAGYRRLPNGAVVCVSLVGSLVSVPEIDHGCGLTSPAHVRVEVGRHTVVVDGYTQTEVEEALWGDL